jgi:probable rRNA maturation factor
MPGEICLTNRQKTRSIDLRLLRRITRFLIEDHFHRRDYEFCVHLVAAPEMASVNEQFLQHAGSTDVITFDYASPGQRESLSGEVFICIDEAVSQAREFRTSWQSELVRYIVHSLLHLHGYDDLKPEARKKMKREEEAVLKLTAEKFNLALLHKRTSRSAAA